jgi:S-adenosylmethionine decarboxylase proenzyme
MTLNTTFGRHLVVEYRGCDLAVLDNDDVLRDAMVAAAEAADTTVVKTVVHRFAPQGVSVVVVIEESHLSLHTWPEAGYAAVDFYTCGECDPMRAHEVLRDALRASQAEIVLLHRGLQTAAESIQQVDRRIEQYDSASSQRLPTVREAN